MLKHRIIPVLLFRDQLLVKGEGFDGWRTLGTVLPAVKVFNRRDVDEMVLLDIGATERGVGPDEAGIRELARECRVPLAVGGGIREVEDARRILRSGADKVVVNSAAYADPELVTRIARIFGSQAVTVAIDIRPDGQGDWACYRHNGGESTGWVLSAWLGEMERRGAGEFLVTAIDQDGTLNGYDHAALRAAVAATSVPLIAAGGAGDAADMTAAIAEDGASAAAAGALFQFTEQTPAGVRRCMAARGLPVRDGATVT